jgi:glycosyltransferase involved in cell wall biosynthesis
MTRKKISIVIPVYNVEKYIKRCLDSVINQTYKELEIILVNDGSIDNSGNICDEYAKKDERIKVIHKKNGGLSDARNIGIENAVGNYIGFVDSDDWILPNMYESLLNLCEEHDAQISICNVFTDENHINANNNFRIYDKQTIMELLLKDEVPSYACNKLFKREIIGNLRFTKDKYYEDLFDTYKFFNNANKVVKTEEMYYFYYINRADSICNNPINELKKSLDSSSAFRERYWFAASNFPNVNNIALKKAVITSLFALKNMYAANDPEKYEKEIKEIITFFKQNFMKIIGNKTISFLVKGAFLCSLSNPRLYTVVLKHLRYN